MDAAPHHPALRDGVHEPRHPYHLPPGTYPSPSDPNTAIYSRAQPHLAWDFVLLPRLEILTPRTGFLSLGPYVNQTCGLDNQGNTFARMADIYVMFRGDFCPPTPQLVSRRVCVGSGEFSFRHTVWVSMTTRGLCWSASGDMRAKRCRGQQ
jgi:hypothetical protein